MKKKVYATFNNLERERERERERESKIYIYKTHNLIPHIKLLVKLAQ